MIKKNNIYAIGDFDVAKIVEGGINVTKFQTNIGTPIYEAPEIFLNDYGDLAEYNAEKADVFSLGIVFLQVATLIRENQIMGINNGKKNVSESIVNNLA